MGLAPTRKIAPWAGLWPGFFLTYRSLWHCVPTNTVLPPPLFARL